MNIDNKFLLVCLQLIIVLVMSMIVEGTLRRDALRIQSSIDSLQWQPAATSFPTSTKSFSRRNINKRAVRLYHQCSSKEVRVQDLPPRVYTTANRADLENGTLLFEVRGDLVLRIRGLYSGHYVCYNRRGRLIAKPRKKAKGAKCEFVEYPVFNEGSFRYTSVHNPNWTLGFNTKGQPIRGPSSHFNGTTRHQKDCFKFLKMNIRLEEVPDHLKHNIFDVNEHNRRVGILPPNPVLDQNNFALSRRLTRHSKNPHHFHHRRDRKPHFRRASVADR